MTSRRTFLTGIGVMALAAPLAGCSYLFATHYRFRLSVELDTPQGLKSGTTVLEASVMAKPRVGDSGDRTVNLYGDAVTVELAGGRKIFALLDEFLPVTVARLYFPEMTNDADSFRDCFSRLSSRAMRGQQRLIPEDRYLMLACFRDANDPRTVEVSDAANVAVNIAPGVRVRRMWVELTDARVSTGIKRLLPYGRGKGFKEWFLRLEPGDPRTIGPEDFYREK